MELISLNEKIFFMQFRSKSFASVLRFPLAKPLASWLLSTPDEYYQRLLIKSKQHHRRGVVVDF
jgi:hypothetical protein